MSNLDLLVKSAAHDVRPVWDDERAGRVFVATLARREKHEARGRLLRRSMAVASAAAVVVFVLLRGAGASTTQQQQESQLLQQQQQPSADLQQPGPGMLALERNGDGGYGRD